MRFAFGLAWQTFRHRPERLLAPALVTAAASLTVLVATAFYLGVRDSTVAWLRSLPGDAVVAGAQGSPALMQAYSELSLDTVATVRAAAAGGRVHELHTQRVWLWRADRDSWVHMVAMRRGDDFGRPLAVIAGTWRPRVGEIVIDVVVARELGVGLGDTVRVRASTLRVVGIATGGSNVISSHAFVSRATLALGGVRRPSHLFVEAPPGVDGATLRAALAAVPEVQVLSRPVFEEKNQTFVRQVFLAGVGIIDAVMIAMAIVILAVVNHAGSLEHRMDHALLAALGLDRRQIQGRVIATTLLASVIGLAVGLVTGGGLLVVLPRLAPRFISAAPWWLFGAIAIGALVVGLVAALRPVRAVARVDPGLVFRV